ncbi:MAG: hypothetical protein JWP97_186 [Labilithrix sp.]|nr:hypothetical protein [Labilithrix sp.]
MADPLPTPPSPAALARLLHKYERMRALRVLHVRASTEPGFVEPDPRRAMAELAREFPGVLREIDRLPLDAIEQRIASLREALEDGARREPWMDAMVAFHRLACSALAAKRFLAGRDVTPALARALPPEAAEWRDDLPRVGRPPRGRLMDVVRERLARELGIDVAAARALTLPGATARPGSGGRGA